MGAYNMSSITSTFNYWAKRFTYKQSTPFVLQVALLAGDQWWPFFVTILFFFITDVIVLNDSIVWLNKLGVTVGTVLIYILK